jgi:hypothetical protein
MSGYDPLHYEVALEQYGLPLRPRYVLCMFYEGNDFRSRRHDRKRQDPGWRARTSLYLAQSPLLNALDTWLVETFGSLNCRGPVRGAETLDWLPLAVPHGPQAAYYTLRPRNLRNLRHRREEIARSEKWLNASSHLRRMNELCAAAGCRLIVVYAPTKAHVLFPLVADRLPAEQVRAFASLGCGEELPKAGTLLAELRNNLEARESVVRRWCEEHSIPFISTTGALRGAAAVGTQGYLTYDLHWSPLGHEIVAQAIHHFLAENFPADVVPGLDR